jgi:hypothetical protein
MLVGAIVVDHGLDDLAGRYLAFDGIEEANELLMAVPLHASADNGSFQHIHRGKQRRCAMSDVVVLVWTATGGIDVPE